MTVVAIDFGTSNTAIAILEQAEGDRQIAMPRTLNFNDISHAFANRSLNTSNEVWLVPSLVYVTGDNKFLFGEQARSLERLKDASPEQAKRLFKGFKRDMVAKFQSPAREIDGNYYDAEAIAEIFLMELWQRLQAQDIQPTQLIFTVPVGAFESYLHWFRNFADKIKFSNFQIIDESTAAALGYAVTRPNALVLVIDFGGGTLDLSLVRTAPINHSSQAFKAEAIAKSDAYIGGIDIDRWIAEHFLRQLQIERSPLSESSWLSLLEISEKIKIQLSLAQEVQENWLDPQNQIVYTLKLHQDELSEILEQNQLIDQLREAIDEVISMGLNKGISKAAIEEILLVGGTCQNLAIQQLIISYFGKSKVKLGKPFEAVAHGALVLGQDIAIEDHLRHSYAIRLWEPYLNYYSFYTLFAKGTKYPCQRPEPLILQAAIAGQSEIWLDIGEVAEITQAEVAYDQSGRMTSSQLLKQSDFRSLVINSSNQKHRKDRANGSKQIREGDPQTNLDNDQNRREEDIDKVCIARLDPRGQLGIDRIAVNFEINDRRILMATIRDLLTNKILMEQQAIAKLE